MAEIPTVTMWSPEGKAVRVNKDDTGLQKILHEAGYTLQVPETAPILPPELNPEGDAAQDQAAGEVLVKDAMPGAAKGEYYDIKTKTTRKK